MCKRFNALVTHVHLVIDNTTTSQYRLLPGLIDFIVYPLLTSQKNERINIIAQKSLIHSKLLDVDKGNENRVHNTLSCRQDLEIGASWFAEQTILS
jgi:hypothetical protein